MRQPLRFFYAAGPGDIVGTFNHWNSGESDPSQVAITYSQQFFDFVHAAGGKGLAISSCSRSAEVEGKGIRAVNAPKPRQFLPGAAGYLLTQILYGLYLLIQIIRFKPKVAVIADGTAPWILFGPLAWFGICIVPSIHCVFQTSKQPAKGFFPNWRQAADRFFFKNVAHHSICVSPRIGQQIMDLAGTDQSWSLFHPTYFRETFQGMDLPNPRLNSIRLLYAGRIEKDKGVFELFEAFLSLQKYQSINLELHYCGDGAAYDALNQAVMDEGLQDSVFLHGHCSREVMRHFLGNCFAIVVPTTTAFVEGFNKVVAEGMLSGRPVIATTVCPATDSFEDAVIAIEPDSSIAIEKAILTLIQSPEKYQDLCEQTKPAREAFLNPEYSWRSRLSQVLCAGF